MAHDRSLPSGRCAPQWTTETPLLAVPGIGPARSRILADAGYRTVGELLFHLPLRYEDRTRLQRIASLDGPGSCTLAGRLSRLQLIRSRRRGLTLVRGTLDDGSASLPVLWFNRPYLLRQVNPDTEYLLSGGLRRTAAGLELLNPTCEPAATAVHSGRVVPVYPALGALGPALLRRILDTILQRVSPPLLFEDRLPGLLRGRHGLPELGQAIAGLHRPADEADVAALNRRRSPAHLRLIYGELLELQLRLALLRSRQIRVPRTHRYRLDERLHALLRDVLPFRLTSAQERVVAEITADLAGPFPMLRLLQGDVGSGKTVVAALALVVAVECGHQAAFMAPTELLAEQHHRTLERMLGDRYRVALLTASSPDADACRRRLAAGEDRLVVGTHALIQERVVFDRLALAVIDEQHRFGVVQRQLLQRKGERPDVLVMTATPIPRSLALTAYGDLELSILDELPPGRHPVVTEVVPESSRQRVYEALRRALDAGAQAYVVFPLIEGSDHIEAASIEETGEELRRLFADRSTAVLHGRTPAAVREALMESFAGGEIQLLIATTVIEVGVDVPRATVMVIESAERFGLAQLHQLRGRVGRSHRPSRCVALHGRLSDEARLRLRVFAGTCDGFQIAEADLAQRGPGELLGTRQAGLPRFRAANLVEDREWLEKARADARELLRQPGEQLEALVAGLQLDELDRWEQFGGG